MSAATLPHRSDPVEAYDRLAPAYDLFTAGHDHERWLGRLEAELRRHGLRGDRVLDVACGTGASFVPLLRRGYHVRGCDLSPEMAALARDRHPEGSDAIAVADMRELPFAGPFDLVTCLDDAVNYLLGDDDLVDAFGQVARVLAPTGLYVFDVNTRRTYREAFGGHQVFERDGTLFCWRGGAEADAGIGDGLHAACVEVVTPEGDGWQRATSLHVQRHRDVDEIASALAAAGLECVTVLGQQTGARLHHAPDEERDTKLVVIARRAPRFQVPDRRRVVPHGHHRPDHRPVSDVAVAGGRRAAGLHAVPFAGHLLA